MGSPETEMDTPGQARSFRATTSSPDRETVLPGYFPSDAGTIPQFVAAEKYQTDAEKDGQGANGTDARGRSTKSTIYNWRTPGMYGNQQTDEHPVVSVTWNDAVAFCEWLSKKESKKYRLPTQAEWEYACRAGTKTAYNFGDWLNGTQANCNGGAPYGTTTRGPFLKGTTKVGSYKPNAFGLYDMHGNVFQWCGGWWDTKYDDNSPTDEPTGPDSGLARPMRGGGWESDAGNCRSASRLAGSPDIRTPAIGFRVVLDVSDIPKSGMAAANPPQQPTPPSNPKAPGPQPPTTEPAAKLKFAKWVYPADEKGLPGYFQKGEAGWVEVKDGKLYSAFKETDGNADYIEILDESRGLYMRIMPTQSHVVKRPSSLGCFRDGQPYRGKIGMAACWAGSFAVLLAREPDR